MQLCFKFYRDVFDTKFFFFVSGTSPELQKPHLETEDFMSGCFVSYPVSYLWWKQNKLKNANNI